MREAKQKKTETQFSASKPSCLGGPYSISSSILATSALDFCLTALRDSVSPCLVLLASSRTCSTIFLVAFFVSPEPRKERGVWLVMLRRAVRGAASSLAPGTNLESLAVKRVLVSLAARTVLVRGLGLETGSGAKGWQSWI